MKRQFQSIPLIGLAPLERAAVVAAVSGAGDPMRPALVQEGENFPVIAVPGRVPVPLMKAVGTFLAALDIGLVGFVFRERRILLALQPLADAMDGVGNTEVFHLVSCPLSHIQIITDFMGVSTLWVRRSLG